MSPHSKLCNYNMQYNYISMLEKKFNEAILVSFMNKYHHPGKWMPSKIILDKKKCADYRTILNNELIIDIDAPQWNIIYAMIRFINRALIINKIPYILAYSGGRGVHYHIFFDDHYLLKVADKRQVKKFLFDCILVQAGLNVESKYYDQSPINKSRSLIRVIGGKKISYKTMLMQYTGSKFTFNREIPKSRIYNYDIHYPRKIYIWDPFDVLINYRDSKITTRYAPEKYIPVSEEYPYALTEWVYMMSHRSTLTKYLNNKKSFHNW